MEPPSKHAHFLFDLGRLLRAQAQEAHERVDDSPAAKSDFAAGEMMTWVSVLSTMQQQAVASTYP